MDDTQLFDFDSPLNQSSYIKVIGVGGGGNNAVNHMFKEGITGVDFIVCNTDLKALNSSPVPNKLVLGTQGLGAGGRPEKARKAAEAKEDEIRDLLSHNTKMLFITAGMGGGTGTGAAPVIARIAKEIELESDDSDSPAQILVVAVVTTPFYFEGRRRLEQAFAGVEELRKHVDSILVINNEKLRGFGNLVMSKVFNMADDVLLTAVKGIAEIITLNAYINIDFRDVHTVMEKSGTALMGIGEGQGERRGLEAVEKATESVLLNDDDITGAKNVLLYLAYGPECEITMDEMSEVTDFITNRTGSIETNVIFGTGFDEKLGDKVKVTLIATGFEQKEQSDPKLHILTPDKPKEPEPVVPAGSTEPVVVRREPAPELETPIAIAPAPPEVVVAPAESEPAPEKPRRVFVLDDEANSPKRPVTPVTNDASDFVVRSANPQAQHTAGFQPVAFQPMTNVEPQVEAPAPVNVLPTPAPVSAQPRVETVGAPNELPADRIARIKYLHDLLRNHEDGPQRVAEMDPFSYMDQDLYQARPSSQSEAAVTLNANGQLNSVSKLHELPD